MLASTSAGFGPVLQIVSLHRCTHWSQSKCGLSLETMWLFATPSRSESHTASTSPPRHARPLPSFHSPFRRPQSSFMRDFRDRDPTPVMGSQSSYHHPECAIVPIARVPVYPSNDTRLVDFSWPSEGTEHCDAMLESGRSIHTPGRVARVPSHTFAHRGFRSQDEPQHCASHCHLSALEHGREQQTRAWNSVSMLTRTDEGKVDRRVLASRLCQETPSS